MSLPVFADQNGEDTLSGEADTSNSAAVNVSSSPSNGTNMTEMTTQMVMTTMGPTTISTTSALTTETTSVATTQTTTEYIIPEETTKFTPMFRKTTTPPNGFLAGIPLLGSLIKGLGIKIKGCRCRAFICSCCSTAKLDSLGGDGKKFTFQKPKNIINPLCF